MTSYGDMHEHTVPSVLLGGDVADTMLNSLKRRSDISDTGRWLTSLVDQAMDPTADGDAEDPVTHQDLEQMIRWVGKLFDEFELYKLEFNQKAAGTDLIVASSPVNLENLSAVNDSFEAHLSTRFWSLAFDASTHNLDVYLLPAELLLAFTTNRVNDTDYKPFMSFRARRRGDQYFWTVDQQLITFELLPKLAKELFSDLINVASGNVKEEEIYRHAPTEAPSPARPEAAVTDRSYEEETPITSVFKSADGGTALLKPESSSAFGAETLAGSVTALSDEICTTCQNFTTSIDREMASVIEFARTHHDNVETLMKCKELLLELTSIRSATELAVEKMRAISSAIK